MKLGARTLLRLAGPVLIVLAVTPAPGRGQGGYHPPCIDMPKAVVLTPDGSIPFTVTIKDGNTACYLPLPGFIVEVEFSPEADALVAWPPWQTHPILTGSTDENGQVTFRFAGAGCIDPNRLQNGSYVVAIFIDGIRMAEIPVTSPDVVNSEGLLPTDLGAPICEDGVSTVSLSDAVFHTNSIKNALVEPCSKVTGSPQDPVNLDDAVVLTPYIRAGGTIACQ